MSGLSRYHRQSTLIDQDKLDRLRIHVVGAGGIGSATVVALTKMGANVTVWDHDTVEEHNLPNQLLPARFIGEPKVDALDCLTQSLEGRQCVVPIYDKYQPDNGDILVLAVDSLRARQEILKSLPPDAYRYIVDGRMAAEEAHVHCEAGTPDGVRRLLKTTEGQPYVAPCTERATVYTTMSIAGSICAMVKNILNDVENPRETLHIIPAFYQTAVVAS